MHQINHQSHDKCWDKGAFSKNTKNDKRLRQSVEKIENAFVEALQAKKLSQISVSDVCKAAEMNRSSFLPILWTFTPFPIKQGRIWKMSSINGMP